MFGFRGGMIAQRVAVITTAAIFGCTVDGPTSPQVQTRLLKVPQTVSLDYEDPPPGVAPQMATNTAATAWRTMADAHSAVSTNAGNPYVTISSVVTVRAGK